MSDIIYLDWDSKIFQGKTGIIKNYKKTPDLIELDRYKLLHILIPQEDVGAIFRYEQLNFNYITTDYKLERMIPFAFNTSQKKSYQIIIHSKKKPDFEINDFQMKGSRLALDLRLQPFLHTDFWDRMIYNHCENFADFCYCAIDLNNKLIGFISCFENQSNIDVFLLIIHPNFQGNGLGKTLIETAWQNAIVKNKKLTTSVVSHNLPAINFYMDCGFRIKDAFISMHFFNQNYQA